MDEMDREELKSRLVDGIKSVKAIEKNIKNRNIRIKEYTVLIERFQEDVINLEKELQDEKQYVKDIAGRLGKAENAILELFK